MATKEALNVQNAALALRLMADLAMERLNQLNSDEHETDEAA